MDKDELEVVPNESESISEKSLVTVINVLISSSDRFLALEEISDLTGLSESTIRRVLKVLDDEQFIKTVADTRKKKYSINVEKDKLDDLKEAVLQKVEKTGIYPNMQEPETLPRNIFVSKIEEIAHRQKSLKRIIEYGVSEIREEIKGYGSPESVKKELVEAAKRGKVDLSDSKIRKLESIELYGNSLFKKWDFTGTYSGMVIGTDASKNELAIYIRILGAPVDMNLSLSAGATCPIEYQDGASKEHPIRRLPESPLSAGHETVEELSTKLPESERGMRSTLGYVYMDRIHSMLDQGALADIPDLLLRDGLVHPGYSYYSVYDGLDSNAENYNSSHQDVSKIAWECMTMMAKNARNVKRRNKTISGVVRNPTRTLFSLLFDWIISKKIPEYKFGTSRNDQQILDFILRDSETTCNAEINLKESVLSGIYEKKGDNTKEFLEKYLGKYTDEYLESLSDLSYNSFFLNISNKTTRYDYLPPERNDLEELAKAAYQISAPPPRSGTSSFSSKKIEIIPAPVAVADKESRRWVDQLGDSIEDRTVNALMKEFSGGEK